MTEAQVKRLLDAFQSCVGSLERIADALESAVALQRNDPLAIISAALAGQGGEEPEAVPFDETELSPNDFIRLVQR